MRPTLVVLLAGAMVVTSIANGAALVPASGAGTCSAGDFAGGAGSAGDPFQVSNATQLTVLATNAACRATGLHFRQTQSIALAGPWTPIGSEVSPFQGSYDGLGNAISGLSIDDDAANGSGLFGALSGATVSNLNVSGAIRGNFAAGGLTSFALNSTIANVHTNVPIVLIGANAGGLIGSTRDTEISDSSASGSVGGSEIVGGLIGLAESTTVTNSRASGDVTGSTILGGLIGQVEAVPARPAFNVVDSHATGNVTTTGDGGTGIGGLIGFIRGDSDFGDMDFRVERASATGNVTGSQRVGGLIGRLEAKGAPLKISIDATYSEGAVSGSVQVGGLIGLMDGNFSTVDVTRSRSSSVVTGDGQAGGFIGVHEIGAISNSYATGSVTATGDDVGGFSGRDDRPGTSLTNVYAIGRVQGRTNIGGLIGNQDNAQATATFWNPVTSGVTTAAGNDGGSSIDGAAPLTTQQMRSSTSFTGWNFDTTWGYQCATYVFPQLRILSPSATALGCPETPPQPPPPGPSPQPQPGPDLAPEPQPTTAPTPPAAADPEAPKDPVQEIVDQIRGFTPAQIKALTAADIKALPPAAFAAMTPAQVRALQPRQVRALGEEQVRAVAPRALRAMQPRTLKRFTVRNIRSLTQAQVRALRPKQIKALGPTKRASINQRR